jgi:hypothetical protein
MKIPTNPFQTAERYMQVRKRCMPASWGDIVILFNEMVVGPIVTLFLLFLGSRDVLMVFSAITRANSAWSEWEEYHSLQSVMHHMFFIMTLNGGPVIRTNDPYYFPYVLADAMVRLGERRPHP